MPYFLRVTMTYLGGILLCFFLFAGAGYVAEVYFKTELPTSSTSVISTMIPAMMAGMTFVKRIGERPVPREMWGFSLWFAIIQFAIGGTFLAAIGFFRTEEFTTMASGENFATYGLVALVVLFAVIALLSRAGLGLGVKTALKTMERAARS